MERHCGTHYITDCSSSPFSSSAVRIANSSSLTVASNASTSNDTSSSDLLGKDSSVVEAVIELYVIGVLIVFGIVANVVSIVVLKRYRERRDSLFLLQALAIVDCLYLVAAALRYPLKYLLRPSADADPYTDMQPTVFPILKTFQVHISSGYSINASLASDPRWWFLAPCCIFWKPKGAGTLWTKN